MRLWTLQCAMSLHVSVRSPLTLASFFHTFVPPWLLYYLLNVLAILGPTTFVYRLALLPVTLFMSYRAVVSLDIARGFLSTDLGRLEYLNHCMALLMFTIFTRSLVRTFSSQTPRRKDTRNQLAWDAADLTFNLRSVGWNLSAGMKVGPMRPLAPSAYLAATARSLAIHILILDCLLYIGQLLAPVGGVYDMTIADPFLRSVRTTVITFLVGLCVHSAIQISGDALGLVGVGLIGQSPSEWPPIFDSPWLATSLTDFWATRWHQIFRQDFVALGAKPLSLVAGRPGGVLGAFLMSGVLHYVGTWGMGRGTDVRVIYYFLMMGVGVILEGFWRRLTGSRVSGWVGWMWTYVWTVGWGPLTADPWCLSGILVSVLIPQPLRPAVWLHRLTTNIYIAFSQ